MIKLHYWKIVISTFSVDSQHYAYQLKIRLIMMKLLIKLALLNKTFDFGEAMKFKFSKIKS